MALNPPSIYSKDLSFTTESPEPESEEDDERRQEDKDVWTRFCSAVWDTLSKHSGRDIISFRIVCNRLWPSFTAPLRDGTFRPKEFSRLLVAKRALLQDESILIPNIVSSTSIRPATQPDSTPSQPYREVNNAVKANSGLGAQLPYISRLILVASYLASYTPARHDILLFTKSSSKGKKKKGGGTALSRSRPGVSKSRKISRKLLGPQAFVLERMLSIFQFLRLDADVSSKGRVSAIAGSADVLMAVATLASLRLIIKTSAVADPLDASTKWKANVGWEVVRGLARSVGVEVEDFLID